MYCSLPFKEYYLPYGNGLTSCCAMQPKSLWHQLNDIDFNCDLFSHESLVKIRKEIKSNTIAEECKICLDKNYSKGFLTTELYEFDHNLISCFIEQETKVKQIKLGCFRQCNCQCKMCSPNKSTSLSQILDIDDNFINEKSYKDSLKKIKYISDQIIKGNLNNINLNLCGGEPLLDTTLAPIYEALRNNKDVGVTIVSNMSLDNELAYERLNIICDRKISKIVWSCDGPKEIHEYIRNCDATKIENMFKFIKAKYDNCKITVNSTLHSLNANYFKQTLEYIQSMLGMVQIDFLYDQQGVVGLDVLPKEVLKQYYDNLVSTKDTIDCFNSRNMKTYQLLITILKIMQEKFDSVKWLTFCKHINKFDRAQHKNVFDFYPEFKEHWINE